MTLFGQEITIGTARRGSVIRLKEPYKIHSQDAGFKNGVVVEEIGNQQFGCHLFGYTFRGKRITVDLKRDQFDVVNQLDV